MHTITVIRSASFGLLFAVSACSHAGPAISESSPSSTSAELSNNNEEGKSGHDMKAMFGPDYKKGDIGHSTGVVKSVDPETAYMVIDHGPVHGTSMGPMTMAFETSASIDVSKFSANDKVEFLVRLDEEGAYSIFAICDTVKDGPKCLLAK